MPEFSKANPEVSFRREDDESILFNPDSGAVSVLNATGTLIFKLCDGNHDVGAMVSEIMTNFEIEDAEQVKKDVQKFLDQMNTKGFIQMAEE